MPPLTQILGIVGRKSGRSRRRPGRARFQGLKQIRRYTKVFLYLLVMLSVGTASWHFYQSEIFSKASVTVNAELSAWLDKQIKFAGLTVEHVFVTGRSETTKLQVLKAIGIIKGQSVLAFNPALAQDRLLQLGWVETARVERRLPNTILVHLSERKALAIWQNKGRHILIDRSGKPITKLNLDRFAHLPIVVGKDAPNAAAILIDMLAQKPELFALVQAAVRIGGRRWNIRLTSGINIQLPELRAAEAWTRLANLAAEQQIFNKDLAAIDLRLPDRLVLRLTPEAAAKKIKSEKET